MRFLAERVLGEEGRILSESLSPEQRPDNIDVYKAHLAVSLAGAVHEIWHGDLDLTLWEQRLIALCRLIDHDLYLFYDGDHDAATEAEAHEKAVAIFHLPGETLIPFKPASYISRDDDGTLRLLA